MAKRESQGMQIAVILLVMFSLLFAVTTVLFWNQSKKANAALTQLKSDKAASDQNTSEKPLENQDLRQWVGFTADTDFNAIRTQVEKDLAMFGQNFPKDKRNLRELPAYLLGTIQDLHARLNEASERESKLKAERDQAREEERRNVKVAEDNHQTAATDLKSEQKAFADEVTRLQNQLKSQQTSNEKQARLLRAEEARLEQQLSKVEAELASLEQQNDRLSTQVDEFRSESFERPDGQITWVNQALRTVYIDLGSADAVRPQFTFSVYDVDVNNLARVDKKGSIEITRVLGAHLAEAQILDDKVTNPIIAGDIIYSPIFEKGNPIRFALAGFMDIDGDGNSDRELIKNLIRLQGGVVDAEVDDEGKRTGQVTIETRYLILGQASGGKSSAGVSEELARIQRESDTASVTTISVDRFLSATGYAGSILTVGLGDRVKSEEFRPDRRGNNRFQPLRPTEVMIP